VTSLQSRNPRRFLTLPLLLSTLTTAAAEAQIQPLTGRAPAAADVATLDGIIAAFYDVVSGPAGTPRDWGRDSTLYSAGLRFVFQGENGWQSVDHATYARRTGPFLATGFFEREVHREIHRFGDMAQVFSTYEWAHPGADGPERGRGINSIELVYAQDRWWITYAQWIDESPDRPIPPRFLSAAQ
jgi:hypothetical protein